MQVSIDCSSFYHNFFCVSLLKQLCIGSCLSHGIYYDYDVVVVGTVVVSLMKAQLL